MIQVSKADLIEMKGYDKIPAIVSQQVICHSPFYRIGNCVLYDKKPPCEHSLHWDDALST
jgi:hypothetical protein